MPQRERPDEGGRPQGQLERSLVELAIGTHKAREDRHNALASTRTGEYDQQIMVDFSGTAVDGWGYVDIKLSWEHPFVFAPLQRDPDFQTPLVTSHIEFTHDSGELLLAHCHVRSWQQSDQGWYYGAIVRLAVSAPGQTAPVAYAGVMHLNFQGFASPTDEDATS